MPYDRKRVQSKLDKGIILQKKLQSPVRAIKTLKQSHEFHQILKYSEQLVLQDSSKELLLSALEKLSKSGIQAQVQEAVTKHETAFLKKCLNIKANYQKSRVKINKKQQEYTKLMIQDDINKALEEYNVNSDSEVSEVSEFNIQRLKKAVMTLGGSTSGRARPYRSHDSTAEYLEFENTEELYQWYRSKLFRPFWTKFNTGYLRAARSARKGYLLRGPSLDATMRQIDLGEARGNQRYSAFVVETDGWSKEDWYAYVLCRIVHANIHNAEGLFFGKREPDPTGHYRLAHCALLNYIRYVNTCPRDPIIPDSAAGNDSDDRGMEDISSTEGLTIIWKNCNDLVHGYLMNNEEDLEDMYHVPLPFGLPTTAAIRNRIRTYFGLDAMKLEIARMFFQELGDGDIISTQMTNRIWTRICSAIPGTRSRIYLLMETRSIEGRTATVEDDNSLDDLPETSDNLDEDGDYRGNYVNDTLDFTGTEDRAYAAMERERGEAEWSLEHRIYQYNTLFDIACLTKTGNPNGDVVWETEALTGIDANEANQQSNVWRKQLELLGEAGEAGHYNHREQAAAAGTLQFQDITAKEKLTFLQQEAWLDNTRLQRENEDEAFAGLGISSRERPRVSGMNKRTILKFWQVVAIWAIYKFHKGYLKGGVLADAVGLGKTIVVLSLIQFKLNLRRTAGTLRERVARYGPAKATMIVVPPTLISQWIDAIREHLPEFTLCLYYGSLVDNSQDEKKVIINGFLHKSWFSEDDDIAKCIILTTYKTIARRHGPKVLSAARTSNANIHDVAEMENIKVQWTVPDPNWTRDLSGCIGDLYLDEGHSIKGGEATSSFIALKWLNAGTTTVVTATPIINDVSDFEGILGILQRKDLWTDDHLGRLGVDATFNPFTDVPNPAHESKWLRCTPQAFRKFVSPRDIDVVTKGSRLLLAMEMCVLKRGYGSHIPFGPKGKKIGDSVKPMQVRTIELQYRKDELEKYRPLHNFAIDNLAKTVDGPDGRKIVVFDMVHWRALKHYSTWLGFEYLLGYHIDKLQKLRQDSNFGLRELADLICENNPSVEGPGESLIDLLQWFANGSPKLRWLCWVLAELTVKRREKMIIWVQFPWQQELLYLFIKEFNIDVRQYHSGLNSRERRNLVKDFHEKQYRVMVLIGSYSVNSYGLNLHGHCRNVLIFEPAASGPVEFQAIGRVFRVGQEQIVRVIRLYLQHSWNEWEEGNGLVKELLSLMAELNMNIFGAGEDTDGVDDTGVDAAVSLGDRDISIRRYVLFDNRLGPAEERPELETLTTEQLLKHISRMLKDQRNFRSKDRKQI
ncbi:hypothetical protein FGG08_005847 [Glutinoglossum americanum]|uniref:Helicase C-terminal domain-containing protein n=1 Tax=Glutinoglossum americanum TaxID=1670608 RepID=A0A9P8KVL9_9PEZI|nr:hypothetical protein FGG08_005847 [Glutinoglossum americanum]